MKTQRGHMQGSLSAWLAAAAWVLTAWSAGAATNAWNKASGGPYDWNASANWTPAAFPNATGDGANVTANTTSALTINLGQTVTVGMLNLGDSNNTHPYTITTNGAGQALIFDNGASAAQLTQVSGSAGDAIAAEMRCNGDLIVTNAAATAARTLTLAGNLSSGASSGTQTVTVATPSAGHVLVQGVVRDGGAAAVALVKTGLGAGTLILTNANTFSGGLTVSAGTVTGYAQTSGSPFGDAAKALTIGSADSDVIHTSPTLVLNGIASATTTAHGDLIAAGSFNSGTLSVSAPAGGLTTLQCANRVRSGNATLVVAPGVGGLGVSNRITFTGSGMNLVNGIVPPWLVATNNYGDFLTYAATGLTNATYVIGFDPVQTNQVNSITTATNLAGTRGAYALKAGANINLNGNGLTVGDGATAGMILNNASITNGGSSASVTFSAPEALVYVGAGRTGTIGVPIAGASSLTKFGAGTLTLLGDAALYAGDLAIQAGTLTLNPNQNVSLSNLMSGAGTLAKAGANVLTVVDTANTVGALTVSGGALAFEGSTQRVMGAISVSGGTLQVGTPSSASVVTSGRSSLTFGTGGNVVVPNGICYAKGMAFGTANNATLSIGDHGVLDLLAGVIPQPSGSDNSIVIDGGILTNVVDEVGSWNSIHVPGGTRNTLTVMNGGQLFAPSGSTIMVGGPGGSGSCSLYIGGAGLVSTAVVGGLTVGGGRDSGAAGTSLNRMIVSNAVLRSTATSIGQDNSTGINTRYSNSVSVLSGGYWNVGGGSISIGRGNAATAPRYDNWLTIDAGTVTNAGTLVLGSQNTWGNTATLANGGQLWATGVSIGVASSVNSNNSLVVTGGAFLEAGNSLVAGTNVGNVFTSDDGILQFTSGTPTITHGGNVLTIKDSTISFRGVTNANVNGHTGGTQLTNLTFSGLNAFRLACATNTSAANQTYVFDPGLGATNYYRLEMVGGVTRYRGQAGNSLTIGAAPSSGGEMLCSNTAATVAVPFTNNGTLTIVNSTLNLTGGCTFGGGSVLNWSTNSGPINVSGGVMTLPNSMTVNTGNLDPEAELVMITSTSGFSGSALGWTVSPVTHRLVIQGTSLTLQPWQGVTVLMVR